MCVLRLIKNLLQPGDRHQW